MPAFSLCIVNRSTLGSNVVMNIDKIDKKMTSSLNSIESSVLNQSSVFRGNMGLFYIKKRVDISSK